MTPEIELIDTHAHLYLPEFDEDRAEMIVRAQQQGVRHFFLPNIDSASIDRMLRLVSVYPHTCHAMIGLHPCSVKENFQKELQMMEDWLGQGCFSAIGEIGTDLYWDTTFQKEQITCLEQQLIWAKEYKLPVVLHSRESLDLNIEIVTRVQDGTLRGVFHCFTGTLDQAKQIMDIGFYLGIGGVVTFKNSQLAQVVAALPLESLLLETDSPYLAPHPHRGKRNESSYIIYIAEKIASAKDISLKQVCDITSRTARMLFQLNVHAT